MMYKVRVKIFSGSRSYIVRFRISIDDFRHKFSRLDGIVPYEIMRDTLSPRTYSRVSPLVQYGENCPGYFEYTVLSIQYVD